MALLRLISAASIRTSAWIAMAGVIACCGGTLFGFADEPKEPETGDLTEISNTAQGYKLTLGAKHTPLRFQTAPVLNWSNATRNGPLGGTFIWTLDGRPEVIACIFEGNGDGLSFAFQSLSTSKLNAETGGKSFWHPQAPGITLKEIAGAPPPADSAPKRLIQLRTLARRFHCRLVGEIEHEDLRLMSTPVYRYKTDLPELIDGALFAFAQGTDPEVILTLEARKSEGQAVTWQYALTRRTTFPLEAKLDDKRVWSVPEGSGAPNEAWFTGTFEQFEATRK